MSRAASFAVVLILTGPAVAQAPISPIAPGAAPPGAGRTAIDPMTARPGVTAPDGPLYDPVTGMPTQARMAARGRAGSSLNPPLANPDPFGTQTVPGVQSRSGFPNTPGAIDPFTAQPGVQQMRTGTYDPYANRPGVQQTRPNLPQTGSAGVQRPPGAYGTTPPGAAGVAPGYPTGGYPTGGYPTGGSPTGGYPTGGYPTGGYPGGGYGASPPALDPYTGSPTDKFSYGRR